MKRFFIFTNTARDINGLVAERVRAYLEKNGADCETAPLFGKPGETIEMPADTDVCITLGGDGTILEAAHYALPREIPLFGVNLGKVGYLTEVGTDGLEAALDRLLADDIVVEPRMMLEGRHSDGNTRVALNDIVIARYGAVKMVRLNVTVNDIPLYSYNADGVILASPTGSTGYNMSAGGPIVEPTAQLMLLTPISAHTLTARSLVLSAEDRVVVEIADTKSGQDAQEAESRVDAAHTMPFVKGDRIEIMRAKSTTKIVRLNRVSFLDVLHRKLG